MDGKAVEMDESRFKRVADSPIHWSVRFGQNVKVGENVVIDEGCSIGDDVFVGHNSVIRSEVKIGAGSIIGHLVVIEKSTEIGQKTTIQSQCHITAHAKIGDFVFFGPKVMCINTRRISHGRGFDPQLEGPEIAHGARIGAGAIILPGRKIGNNAVIGAGSLIVRDVPARQIWFGSPASYHGEVPSDEIMVKGGPA
jgi:UDP-2-acetamido-3-amino-2,3-dideoxy-glucuronate N-acetyltransferase